MRAVLFAAFLPPAAGHATMTFPPPRHGASMSMTDSNQDNVTHWFSQGCQPGCPRCTDEFGNTNCNTIMQSTNNDPKYLTWRRGQDTRKNPWRSPGYAPVFSPCGISGGGNTYHPSNGAYPANNYPQGTDMLDLPELKGVRTEWEAGSAQDVAWTIVANHGGGYAYRLCPKSGTVNEDCFQKHHLRFASEQSWIQFSGRGSANRTAFTPTRLSQGTNPTGSEWTRNPLPACGDPTGGVGQGMRCAYPPQFESPLPDFGSYVGGAYRRGGLYGYGGSACFSGLYPGAGGCTERQNTENNARFNFNIVDKVSVPADLPPGDYLLSFRWDSEQTPQVWAQCADITITASPSPTPPGPAPAPVPPAPVPPTPPVGPTMSCVAELAADCGIVKGNAAACAGCITRNVAGLRAAGCNIQLGTHDDSYDWCHQP